MHDCRKYLIEIQYTDGGMGYECLVCEKDYESLEEMMSA